MIDKLIIKIFKWWFYRKPLKQYYIKILRPLTDEYMNLYLRERNSK